MSEASLSGSMDRFLDAYQAFAQVDPYRLQNEAIFAVGLLIGGSFPNAAAATARNAEAAFPGRVAWPWTHEPLKPS